MAFSKYLKDRPFLVMNLVHMTPKGAHTNTKNYGKEGKWQLGESVSIEDSIKDRHMTTASVIVDILKAKVIKNRLEKSDEEVMEYLVTKYKDDIVKGIQVWMRKKNIVVTPKQIEKIEKNIDTPGVIALALDDKEEGAVENV